MKTSVNTLGLVVILAATIGIHAAASKAKAAEPTPASQMCISAIVMNSFPGVLPPPPGAPGKPTPTIQPDPRIEVVSQIALDPSTALNQALTEYCQMHGN